MSSPIVPTVAVTSGSGRTQRSPPLSPSSVRAPWEPPVPTRTDPTVATSRACMARLPGGSVPMLRGVDYEPLAGRGGTTLPVLDGTAPSAAAAHDHAAKHYEDDGADDGGEDGAEVEHAVHGVIPCH